MPRTIEIGSGFVANDAFAGGCVATDPGPSADICDHDTCVVIGTARLDNGETLRAGLRCLAKPSPVGSVADLELVAAVVASRGIPGLTTLIGDFALVVWDKRTRTLGLIRDALGVRSLYYRQERDQFVVSSAASLLAIGGEYDKEFVADFLATGASMNGRTVYSGVRELKPAELLTVNSESINSSVYWTPKAFSQNPGIARDEAAHMFRTLLGESITRRVTEPRGTWCHLSGGLDSSSIVMMTHQLNREGLLRDRVAGVISITDDLGNADERPYQDAVVHASGLPQETVFGYWPCMPNADGPPLIDQPTSRYVFYARDQRLCDLVRRHGGNTMLSGHGADHYLCGDSAYLADLLRLGQLRTLRGELLRWSVARNRTVWYYLKHLAVRPLVPLPLLKRIYPQTLRPLRWIRVEFAKQYRIAERGQDVQIYATRGSSKYAGALNYQLAAAAASVDRGIFEDGIETRYPFLYRPLVEFALTLLPTMLIQPTSQKRVLRDAMKDVLPELVHKRTDKGGMSSRLRWAITYRWPTLAPLMKDPLLAQMGIIDQKAFTIGARRVGDGRSKLAFEFLTTLSLELWLRVRSGQFSEAPALAGAVSTIN